MYILELVPIIRLRIRLPGCLWHGICCRLAVGLLLNVNAAIKVGSARRRRLNVPQTNPMLHESILFLFLPPSIAIKWCDVILVHIPANIAINIIIHSYQMLC